MPEGVQLLCMLTSHVSAVVRIGWSPDGHLLATPSRDAMIRIRDTNPRVYVRAIHGRGAVLVAAFDNSTEFTLSEPFYRFYCAVVQRTRRSRP